MGKCKNNFIGIIPARYGSTRFPGKPLALIGGKPMIERVYTQACKALDHVYVATDDQRIYDTVLAFGGQAVMTRSDHRCGTERCLEAFERLRVIGDGLPDSIIINIQGDEPFIQPEQIELLKACFDDANTQIATLVMPFDSQDVQNPNSPKVDWNTETGVANMFSRQPITASDGQYYKHIGIYAYRAQVLQEIVRLPQSPLEIAERLEQLRWIENGYRIRVAVTNVQSIGIDTPEDLIKAEKYILTS